MKTLLLAVLFAASSAHAQPKAAAVGAEIEALITVESINKQTRVVTFRGPRGNLVDMQVPPESQNLDQVKKGSVFKIKYAEALAVSITRGGAPSQGEETSMNLAKKGANPGGSAVRTRHISGRIEAVDLK